MYRSKPTINLSYLRPYQEGGPMPYDTVPQEPIQEQTPDPQQIADEFLQIFYQIPQEAQVIIINTLTQQ